MITSPPVFTVSQLNRQVRSWLEHEMGMVRVEGEISNLSKPTSGHFYFTLKDAAAQLRCVYFRNRHPSADNNRLQNGQQVLIQGTLSVYEARGDYQLIVDELREAGQGDLFQQFELLKIKLAASGLFDPARKKRLPRFPGVIGVITSGNGAALRDILSTLERRFPLAYIIVFACEVQGKNAASQLINAISRANQDSRCDVLILARGGGSMEDLWAFNDERLAHTIANSHIPIVSGVGHETDFTIADFVADLRAETPTAAAVAVTPNLLDLMITLETIEVQLITAIKRFIQHQQLLLHHEMQKITSPKQMIGSHWQSLDYLRNHLLHALKQLLMQKRHVLHSAKNRLDAKNPIVFLQQSKSHLHYLENCLSQQAGIKINGLKQQFASLLATLHAVSPLATLDRGYAIATRNNKVILNSQAINMGDIINIRLAKGSVTSKVLTIE